MVSWSWKFCMIMKTFLNNEINFLSKFKNIWDHFIKVFLIILFLDYCFTLFKNVWSKFLSHKNKSVFYSWKEQEHFLQIIQKIVFDHRIKTWVHSNDNFCIFGDQSNVKLLFQLIECLWKQNVTSKVLFFLYDLCHWFNILNRVFNFKPS